MSLGARMTRAAAAAALLASLVVVPAAAADPVPASVTISVPSAPIACRVETEVSALVLDAAGATIAGTAVTWSLMPVASSQDSVVDGETLTGSQGVATTRVWIDCITGLRTLNATAGPVTASVDLTMSTAGMPATSTAPPAVPVPEESSPLAAILVLSAALAAIALFGVRMTRVR